MGAVGARLWHARVVMARERAEPLWLCRFAVWSVCCRVRVANLTVQGEFQDKRHARPGTLPVERVANDPLRPAPPVVRAGDGRRSFYR